MKIKVLCSLLAASHLSAYNQMHVNKVLAASSAGTTIVASGCDLRGAGTLLSGVNFAGAQLSNALFDANGTGLTPAVGTIKVPSQTTNLTNVNFTGATCVSTGFKGTLLRGAIFDNVDIRYADFAGADLTGAQLDQALNVSLARFDGATMPDGTICSTKTWQSASGKTFYCHCPKSS